MTISSEKLHIVRISRVLAVLLLLALCFALFAVPADAFNRTVRIGYCLSPGYYSLTEDGHVAGYGAGYNESIARYAGWTLFYIPYETQEDAIEALSEGKIDIFSPVICTPELEENFVFSAFPIATQYGALLTFDSRDDLIYEDFSHFNGMTVGYVSSDGFLEKFNEYEMRSGFKANLVSFRNEAMLLTSLRSGELDAVILDLAKKSTDMKLLGKFGSTPYFYLLNPQSGDLLVELNETLDSLHSEYPDLQQSLTELYYPEYVDEPFSKRELDFIARSGALKVTCYSNSAPFSYVEQSGGQPCGIDVTMLERISQISGLKFEFCPAPDSVVLSDYAEQINASVIAGISRDRTTMLYDGGFTDPYLESSDHFIGKKGMVFNSTQHLKVALTCDTDEELTYWRSKYPNFDFSRFDTLSDCLAAVHSQKTDMLLCDRYSLDSIMASAENRDLASLPCNVIPTLRRCEVITSNDSSTDVIVSIINKSLRQISEQEREAIVVAASGRYMSSVKKATTPAAFIVQYRTHIFFVTAVLFILISATVLIHRFRLRAQNVIKNDEDKLFHIANNINGGVLTLQSNSTLDISYCNNGFYSLIGCTPEEYAACAKASPSAVSFISYVHPEDLHKIIANTSSDAHEFSMDLRLRRLDDTYIPTLFTCTTEQSEDGRKGFYCVIMDLSEQNKLLERLRIQNRRTELILERVDEIFFEINVRERTVTTSESFISKFGWTMPEHLPDDEKLIARAIWRASAQDIAKLNNSTKEMFEKNEPVSTVVQLESDIQQRCIWCEVLQHPIFGEDNTIATVIGLIRDVDMQITEREKLMEQVQRDPLTGLYNKEAFEFMVRDSLDQLPGQNHALIFLDLDHFKDVNDTLGHLIGDQVLCDVVNKLRLIFSNLDILSRFGGDEFCIFVKNIPVSSLRNKLNWLIKRLSADYEHNGASVHVSCSCGIACTQNVGFDYDELMGSADKALYYSKETGRSRYTFFEELPPEQTEKS